MPASDSHDGQIKGAKPPPAVPQNPSNGADTSDSDLFKPGDLVGGSYEVLDILGHGAMGTVYKAKHVSMDAEYALKVLTAAQLNENAVLRFQNEAQALAKLNHPNLIGIYNFGLHDGRLPFYVMDLLYGDNLLDKVDAHGPMPVEAALRVFIEVCAGLSYAHRKGILHRDVKPANFVILDAPDVRGAHVKVVDFGLVKFAEEIKPEVQKLTAIGEVCGSPSYMSPEQSSGQKIDPRSDIYSLGCSLFQILTGRLPFLGRNATETMMMQHETTAPTLTSKGGGKKYSEDLERLVAKMLAKAPMDRYQTMDSLANDLKNVMEGKALGTPQVLPASPGKGTGMIDAPLSLTSLMHSSATVTTSGINLSERTQPVERVETADVEPVNVSVERVNSERTSIQRSNLDDKSKSAPGKEKLEDEPRFGAPPAKMIATSVLSVGLVSVILFFTWHALQPAQKTPSRVQTVSVPVATGRPIRTGTTEDSPLPMFGAVLPTDVGDAEPVELPQVQYFSKTISANGRQFIEFDFPTLTKNQSLGWLSTSFENRHRIDGPLRFDKGSPLYFTPAPGALKTPHFIEKFRPGEITGIYIHPMMASDELFNCAAGLQGIYRVMIARCPDLTEKIIPSLNKLNPTMFDVTASTIDGKQLARIHFWQNLKVLLLSECKNVTPILQQLSGSKKLEVLDVSDTELNGTDYKLIAKLPNLKVLNLTSDTVTTQDLRALARLPNLKAVSFVSARWGGASLCEELSHFPALRELTFVRGSLKKQDLELLWRQRPTLRVTDVLDDQSGMMSRFGHHGHGGAWHRMSSFGSKEEGHGDLMHMVSPLGQEGDGDGTQMKSPLGQEGDGDGAHIKAPLGQRESAD